MLLKTFALKMAPAGARIWPRLAYLFQVRSTAEGGLRVRASSEDTRPEASPPAERGGNNLKGFLTQNGASQAPKIAFSGLFAQSSLGSGT